MQESKQTAVALGNFDGLHRGHRFLLEETVSYAHRHGLSPAVWTFLSHPKKELSVPGGFRVLMSAREKERELRALGIRQIVSADFSAVRNLSPRDFCRRVLQEELQAAAVFCGFNFRFGKNREGTAEDLKREMALLGVPVFVCEPFCQGGEPVSSTRIRRLLQEGKPEEASLLLGRPYALTAEVEHGKALGERIGFPTLNQSFAPDAVLPRFGVYAVRICFGETRLAGVCNVGCRPTLDDGEAVTAETHCFDFSGDLYGQVVTVEFHRFLRAEKKYADLASLRRAIGEDCLRAKEFWKENA